MAEGGRKARSAGPSNGNHGGGHHGGAWKVAYADFTTAMMAFFLLLWILSSTSPEQKQSIANYFRDDGPFRDGGATKGGGSIGKNGAGIMPHSGDKLKELEATIPLGRLGRPEDIACAVVYLASEEAGYVTGQVLNVSGGLYI